MGDGFSYRGVHCSAFGVGYIPGAKNRLLASASFSPIEETVTGKAGGYHYGSKVDIREFELPCFVEDVTIDMLERMLQWLGRDSYGKLIFDDRPEVYYMVSPSSIVVTEIYPEHEDCHGEDVYSGTLTIHFKAYEPFGCLDHATYADGEEDGAVKHCGILPESMTPMPYMTLARDSLGMDILCYNPGTEMTDTILRIGGDTQEPITIENATTGDVCKIYSLPLAPDYLELDSGCGSVRQMPSKPDGFAFERHNYGFIRLAPCTPYHRDVYVSYSEGSNEIAFQDLILLEEDVGRYVFLGGEWRRIIYVSDQNHAVINVNMPSSGTESTAVVRMNEITVSGDMDKVTQFDIAFVPRVR